MVALEDSKRRSEGPGQAHRLRPGCPSAIGDLLWEVLGVRPGSVTPFAVINDTDHRVTVVLDQAMMAHDLLNYHPLDNGRDHRHPVAADLLKFLRADGPRSADCRTSPERL